MTDDDLTLKIKMTRGGESGNKETMTATVSAPTVEELDDRVSRLRERMDEWALEFRDIQPGLERSLADDQSTLEGGQV